jgi:hypothetical protein
VAPLVVKDRHPLKERKMMKRMLVVPLVVLMLTLMLMVAPASAHVHGVTPLAFCTVDNANSGALGTDGTPADDANGGPIAGLIPRDTGSAPLTVGDGGRTAPVRCP